MAKQGIVRRAYYAGLRMVLVPLFPFFERLGFHVTPIHYYQVVPDTRTFPESLWTTRSELAGVDMNPQGQLSLLDRFQQDFKAEYDQIPRSPTSDPSFYIGNGAFDSVDAEILYAMVRHFRPRRVIEIGSGHSTRLTAQAVRENQSREGIEASFTAIEPYPRGAVRDGIPGLSRLIEQPVQDVPLEEFEALEENDILFIDSTHVVRIGGDVVYEYLEILPRLKKGVVVHIHDIYLPAGYPKGVVINNRWFWTEQYLLQAFLAFNESFEVLWAGSYMKINHPERLAQAFASYSAGTWPGSFWIRKIR